MDAGECIDPTALRHESCFTVAPLDFKTVDDGMFLHKVAQCALQDGHRLEDVAAVLSCDCVDFGADYLTRSARALFQRKARAEVGKSSASVSIRHCA